MEQTSPKLNWKAVLVGAAVDFACSFAWIMVVAIALMSVMAARGLSLQEIAGQLEEFNHNPLLLIINTTIGVACTALGGFVAAHIGRGTEISNAGAVGIVAILIALVMLPLQTRPSGIIFLTLVLYIPAALLGGWIRLRMPRSEPPNKTEEEVAPPLPNPY